MTIRVVPASQSEEQALQVRMAGKLVHERPELLVRGVRSCGCRHHCTSVHEQEDLLSSCATYPGDPSTAVPGPTTHVGRAGLLDLGREMIHDDMRGNPARWEG